MSKHVYWLNACIDDATVCNTLGAAIDQNGGGALTWDRATKIYPSGTTFTGGGPVSEPIASNPPVGRFVSAPMTARGYALCSELAGSGSYPMLNELGLDDTTIAVFKSHVVLEVGPRESLQSHWLAFIESLGYILPA